MLRVKMDTQDNAKKYFKRVLATPYEDAIWSFHNIDSALEHDMEEDIITPQRLWKWFLDAATVYRAIVNKTAVEKDGSKKQEDVNIIIVFKRPNGMFVAFKAHYISTVYHDDYDDRVQSANCTIIYGHNPFLIEAFVAMHGGNSTYISSLDHRLIPM
jgi:hypothetical protein